MRVFLLLATLLAFAPSNGLSRVKDMGFCPDVSSPTCQVRDYWQPAVGNTTGVETYWLLSTNQEVCFVTQQQYVDANIGQLFDCDWRRSRHSTGGGNDGRHMGLGRPQGGNHPLVLSPTTRLRL